MQVAVKNLHALYHILEHIVYFTYFEQTFAGSTGAAKGIAALSFFFQRDTKKKTLCTGHSLLQTKADTPWGDITRHLALYQVSVRRLLGFATPLPPPPALPQAACGSPRLAVTAWGWTVISYNRALPGTLEKSCTEGQPMLFSVLFPSFPFWDAPRPLHFQSAIG